MGTVYAAVESESGQIAAVKVLSAAMGREDGFRERFRAEIESLRKLHHPNIVRIFGYGEEQDYQFYAMELVEGHSLDESIKLGRRFEWQEAVAIVVQVCRALKHAHDRGVIHRDIKPANLLMAPDGTVKLSDFGIAKLFGNTGMTSEGGVLGTAEYMAPEQADGRAASPRSDLYSLGGVFYAILARRPPLRGKDLLDTLHMQRYTVPDPIRKYVADVPEELEQIIAQLLAKAPEERFANALVLSRKLEALLAIPQAVVAADEMPASTPDLSTSATDVKNVKLSGPQTPPSAVRGASTLIRSAPPLSPGSMDGSRVIGGDSLGFQLEGGEIVPPADPLKSSVTVVPPPATFIPVREDEHRKFELIEEEPPAWISPHTWVLAFGLLAAGITLWWYLQPPSADRLYQSVETLAAEEKVERLAEAEPMIAAFLRHYSEDSRARQLLGYQEEIELYRLEKQFEMRARRAAGRDALTPIERAYLEAVQYVNSDPDEALLRFKALRDLHRGSGDASPSTRQCLLLAERQQVRLQKQIDRHAADDCKMLDARLEQAALLASDEPEQAREIFRATIALYGGKAWAKKQVERAREGLEKLPAIVVRPSAD